MSLPAEDAGLGWLDDLCALQSLVAEVASQRRELDRRKIVECRDDLLGWRHQLPAGRLDGCSASDEVSDQQIRLQCSGRLAEHREDRALFEESVVAHALGSVLDVVRSRVGILLRIHELRRVLEYRDDILLHHPGLRSARSTLALSKPTAEDQTVRLLFVTESHYAIQIALQLGHQVAPVAAHDHDVSSHLAPPNCEISGHTNYNTFLLPLQ